MSELWGWASGEQQASHDQQSQMLTNLQLSEGAQKLAAGDIAIKQADIQLQSQQKILSLLQGAQATRSSTGSPGQQASAQSESLASNMDMLANFALESGMPEQAKEYANSASTIRKNQASVEENQAKLQQQHATITGSLMENVHDQQSFDNALMIYQLETGQKSPFAGQRYTPQLADQIRNRASTILQQSTIKLNDAKTKEAEAQTQDAKARQPLIDAQKREADARTEFLQKHGGAANLPSAGDLKAVTDLIGSSYDVDTTQDAANARVLARPIAESAKQMMQENPSLTQSAAVRRAYQEALTRGDLAGLTPKKSMPGSDPEKPRTMPKNQKGLKENQWYTDPNFGDNQPRVYRDGQFWTRAEMEAQGATDDDNAPAKDDDDDGDE
jgi:hypothetical protein